MLLVSETTLRPGRALSALENLPSEIIERILFELVWDVNPPPRRTQTYDIPYFEEEIDGERSGTVGLIAFRLVSRRIRKCSWIALGHVIGETLFDIRSRDSVEALVAISNCKELVPWVKKLTLACFGVSELYPFTNRVDPEAARTLRDLDEVSRAELQRLRQVDKAWYPKAWAWKDANEISVMENDTGSPMENSDLASLVNIVSQCFVALHNVEHINHNHDRYTIPPRFLKFARQYACGIDTYFRTEHSLEGARSAYTGLCIVLFAMAKACMKPRVLELAAQMYEPHCFMAPVPVGRIADIFQRVETLCVSSTYGAQEDLQEGWQEHGPRITISNSVFPALRILGVGGWHADASTPRPISPLPPPWDAPRVTSITIFEASQSDRTLESFLVFLKDTLQFVSFQQMNEAEWYDTILEPLLKLDLDYLEIANGYDTPAILIGDASTIALVNS
ncbi:hypothetical protein BKA66DRAFT_612768 [Pyrenochaeta sp. MPI-SDFR-AT-0127]|nr:hypothetical protein BKA66DRAFT_612768 [Pyrenochaeta sp. MPI-SDFR-AT-0127]